MSRQSYAPRVKYTGLGNVNTYNFGFKIEDPAMLRVVIYALDGSLVLDTRGTDLVNLTSVTYDVYVGGGTVVLPANLANGRTLLLILADDQPLQPFEFRQKMTNSLERIEAAFDWITGPIQTLMFRSGRSSQLHDMDDPAGFNPNWPQGLTGAKDLIPITNHAGTGWAAVGSWLSIPNFAALAKAAVDAYLALNPGGSVLTAPTDGKFGSGTAPPTAGSVTGIDVGDKIADAMDKQELIFEKLAPAKPLNLSLVPLAITGSYAAKQSGTGTTIASVIDSVSPVVGATGPFNDGDQGTLSAEIDGVVAGSQVLTTASDVGTYGALQITGDGDPYVGQPGKAGFWKALNAQINATALTVGIHLAALKHTLTGNSTLTFGVDDPGTTTTTIGSIVGAGTTLYVSGVPSLPVGGTVTVPVTIANAIRTFYNSGSVGSVGTTSAITSSASVTPTGTPNNGDNVVASAVLNVLTGKYTEQVQVNANGINSKGGTGTVASTTTNIRVDTASTESRVSSGTGQYPSTGYGAAWVPTDLLSANKELQMLGGSYQYPPLVNYSTNSPTPGPNYSALTADSYASMRWVTFNLGTKTNVSSLVLNLAGLNLGSTALVTGLALYVRIDGAIPTAGWVDGNAAYPGTGSPSANGDAALDVGSSSGTSKRITFGATVRTGTVFVRVGIPSGSTKKLSSMTVV